MLKDLRIYVKTTIGGSLLHLLVVLINSHNLHPTYRILDYQTVWKESMYCVYMGSGDLKLSVAAIQVVEVKVHVVFGFFDMMES